MNGVSFIYSGNPPVNFAGGFYRLTTGFTATGQSTHAHYFYFGRKQYKINFQSGVTLPPGYDFTDAGGVYPSNTAGFDPYYTPAMGWAGNSANITGAGGTTNASFATMAANTTWQMQLPPTAARYWVTATVGNANMTGANATILVQGLQMPLFQSSGNFYSGGIEVTVSNGLLQVQNPSSANIALDHVEVTPLGAANTNNRYLRGTGYDPRISVVCGRPGW